MPEIRILMNGDFHLRAKSPERRIDDFFRTQIGKVEQCIAIYHENECEAWLQSGDLLDKASSSNLVLSTYIGLLLSNDITIHTIQGQHTLYMRNEASAARTALGVLEAAGVVARLDPNGTDFGDGITVYGFDYGTGNGFDSMVLEQEDNKRNYAVLHAMISPDKLYPGHTPILPETVAAQLGMFDGILCGDYHSEFCVEGKGLPWILNPGCLVRLTASERDLAHHPTCYVLDTEDNSLTRHELDIASAESVFDLSDMDKAKADTESLQKLVATLRSEKSGGLSFRDRLTAYIKDKGITSDIADLIAQGLETENA